MEEMYPSFLLKFNNHNEAFFKYRAKVVRVIDGDTIECLVDLGMRILHHDRFRLNGINTPEIHGVKKTSDEYKAGKEAQVALIDMIYGKEVILVTYKDKKGKYGRWVADVYYEDQDGVLINANLHLVQLGHAKLVKY